MPRRNNISSENYYHFPYVKFHGKYYPLIPVTLRRGSYVVNTFALVDSGASISVFRPEIARALKIPQSARKKQSLSTADGKVGIGVAKINVHIERSEFTANIGFSDTYAASFNILGREGFFPRFSICFNEVMKTVVVVPLKSIRGLK